MQYNKLHPMTLRNFILRSLFTTFKLRKLFFRALRQHPRRKTLRLDLFVVCPFLALVHFDPELPVNDKGSITISIHLIVTIRGYIQETISQIFSKSIYRNSLL